MPKDGEVQWLFDHEELAKWTRDNNQLKAEADSLWDEYLEHMKPVFETHNRATGTGPLTLTPKEGEALQQHMNNAGKATERFAQQAARMAAHLATYPVLQPFRWNASTERWERI